MDGLSMDGKRVLFVPATLAERGYHCEGRVYRHRPTDDNSCPNMGAWIDPRDDSLYCTMHKDAVQERGVDGILVRVM